VRLPVEPDRLRQSFPSLADERLGLAYVRALEKMQAV
jgi:hypothetical protein